MGISMRLFLSVMPTGRTSAVNPKINNALKIFDPTTLPTEMSEFPSIAPVRLTTSSGQEVPNPTMVSPITNSLIPALLAIEEAPFTSQSAPSTTSPRPISNNIRFIIFFTS